MNRTIIAGSRSITDYATVKTIMDTLVDLSELEVGEVVSGGARGVDTLGEVWAKERGIPVSRHLPDYELYDGKRAPLIRNALMAKYAAATPFGKLVLIHRGTSGSAHMKREALKRKLTVYDYDLTTGEAAEWSAQTPLDVPENVNLDAVGVFGPAAQEDYFERRAQEGVKKKFADSMGTWDNITPRDIVPGAAHWAEVPEFKVRNALLYGHTPIITNARGGVFPVVTVA